MRLSRTVPANTWTSWEITAVRSGRATVPALGTWMLAITAASVVLPAPDAPTTATRWPAGMSMLTPSRTSGPSP
nr:hypothetical protein [Glycomyces sambucus]